MSRLTPLSEQVGGSHYNQYKIQPIEYMIANGLGYVEGCVIKYVTRHRNKGGVEDLNKAIHYLELLKHLEYGGDKKRDEEINWRATVITDSGSSVCSGTG